ncbi:unnamed protein product [Coffea canephora]|uniref:Neprosin PEP catalytic domain-containing protein n=1 Tax=Coffea canephora TaxID=49390 RepID=A0A068UIY5_COFCA|nr:unnamed protein product [Coffea canephora]
MPATPRCNSNKFLPWIAFTLVFTFSSVIFQSEDGDIIDCIDIHKQPAFNHPALKNHKIQVLNTAKTPKQRKGEVPIALATQLWHRSGSCPEGTVPIRRMQKKSPNEARKPSFFQHSKKFNISTPSKLLLANHSLTVLHSEGFAYLGAKGDIYVWNPRVELDDEFSTSQVALKSGSHNNFEAVEAGWAVNPGLYKDRQTRFFVYWTNDSSRETGCFDQFCPGFVQVNKEIALGAALLPNSTRGQLAVPIIVYIFKDLKSNNWWINYGEKTNVGYWPAELFTSLNHYAETVQWGGEVYSANLETLGTRPHTATQMGTTKKYFENKFFSLSFLLLEISLAIMAHGVQDSHYLSSQKPLEVASDRNLKVNGVVKSIESEYGDIIDCIGIYKKPAFNHPALKNHKIQVCLVYLVCSRKSRFMKLVKWLYICEPTNYAISPIQMKPSFAPTKAITPVANTTKTPEQGKRDISMAETTQL